MMSAHSPEISVLSSPQRRCHLLLMLCLPEFIVTVDSVCQLNSVDPALTRQDIAEVAEEIQRYHRLAIEQDSLGMLRIIGTHLDQRLCLLHSLRRALRLSPDFIHNEFSAAIRHQLRMLPVDKALYDEQNLTALIQHCSLYLGREFSSRDGHFLQVWLRYSLAWHCRPEFTLQQQQWLRGKSEYALAKNIGHCWRKRGYQATDSEIDLLALLFSQLHIPLVQHIDGDHERQLFHAVELLIQRFQALSGMVFSNDAGLSTQLYTHLAQALERTLFSIGIDHSLVEDIAQQYPRLLRTTREAIAAFEQQYSVQFSDEEMGLIVIIFGAWLMQESALQEKQVLLLIGRDSELERLVERQLRELTLLPLNIKYQDVSDFQRHSAPKGIALVITPYATPLPLYSPPLIHAELPLGEHQQRSIRLLLES
ncbi:stationary phase inducible protein CsiE [Erwinia sorbitola]|uniref:Stationary phase inducible protein CsiE n=1 Tax=Erwinia sorbitola TaxID=2681984 RepID=A0A6I6EPP5_9GAMM|nr:stationary phase inducible protein CsiE [Erwinia sorbitola]MTD28532.1 stationary phase inducible protein CsiE [Erwinia sorbitola]QGU86642.1 stationary phase inducible protein CsiE [Erwinia sorbitola]